MYEIDLSKLSGKQTEWWLNWQRYFRDAPGASFSQSDGEEKQPDGPAPSATNAEESQLKEGEDGLETEHVAVGKDM